MCGGGVRLTAARTSGQPFRATKPMSTAKATMAKAAPIMPAASATSHTHRTDMSTYEGHTTKRTPRHQTQPFERTDELGVVARGVGGVETARASQSGRVGSPSTRGAREPNAVVGEVEHDVVVHHGVGANDTAGRAISIHAQAIPAYDTATHGRNHTATHMHTQPHTCTHSHSHTQPHTCTHSQPHTHDAAARQGGGGATHGSQLNTHLPGCENQSIV